MFRYHADNLDHIPNVIHAFMTRMGGTSPASWGSLNVSYQVGDVSARVDENRARICMQWGLSPSALYVPRQVHGVRLVRVEKESDFLWMRNQEADALYTCDSNLLLGVATADCAPILLSCKKGYAVCVIHAGWRGASQGVVTRVLMQLQEELQTSLGHWVAAIGPCIGRDSFVVGSDVLRSFPSDQDCFTQKSENSWLFDLARVLSRQLRGCGVEHIQSIDRCTFKNPHRFFSYRAAQGKNCGRQLSFIGISR